MPAEFEPCAVEGARAITLWRQRYRFLRGELHFHPCPECYEDGPCAAACEFEPDLSDEDEVMRGSHCVCDACRLAGEKGGG